MHRKLYFIFLIQVFSIQFVFSQKQKFQADSIKVDKLNEAAFENRLRDASNTIRLAKLALHLAQRTKYQAGEAEAYRVIGIGYSYLGLSDAAAKNLISALSIFRETKDNRGLAQTYNNIGSIYRDVTAEKSIPYLRRSLLLAEKEKMHSLIAGCHLNLGIAYLRNQEYDKSQAEFDKSYMLFKTLGNPLGITLSLLNGGALELYKHNIPLAKKKLLEANGRAKKAGLSNTLASINISLITIGLQEKNYYDAEKYLKEGQYYVNQTQDERLQIDYEHSAYELERDRKNYKKALDHLSSVYSKDSLNFNKQISQKIALIEIQHNLWKREQESIQLQKEKKFSQQLNWAFVAVIVLTIVSIITLISLVKKKNKTNEQLSSLNNEISSKKEALDKINKHLEDIIEERTKDLQIKNKKLSDYSSHLSHEIRGPVAASKGLLALKKEQLIDDEEFLTGVSNCIEDIDNKILRINKDLHNPNKDSFKD